MEVIYHPLARRDVLKILSYYHDISPILEEDFHNELRGTIAKAAQNPLRFHPTDQGFRRANIKRFPYHFLYEIQAVVIRVMVVRHNRRHTELGLERE